MYKSHSTLNTVNVTGGKVALLLIIIWKNIAVIHKRLYSFIATQQKSPCSTYTYKHP